MLTMPATATNVLLWMLVFWATTGLTAIHLGVIGVRWARQRLRPKQAAPSPAEPARADLTLTFVVPVYDDALTIGPTIESILAQSVRPDRILVVDDGSKDGTKKVLRAFRKRGVEVLTLPANMGKSRALDVALRHVDTDLVAITDADSVVDADYVKEILVSFNDPQLAAVGGAVESIPHTWVTAARQLEYMLTVHVDRNAETSMNALVVLPGVSTTYRTSVLREMGFEFDTIAEDFDLTFRLQKAERKIAMNLRAKVFTSDPPTLRAYHRQLMRWYTDFWLVLRKHRSVLGKRVFGTVEVPMLVLNATVSSLVYLVLPLVLLFTKPQALLMFFGTGLAIDLALIVIAWRKYRRNDVWLAVASRVPTRFIGRYAYLVAMTRVLVGRPGMEWSKLERRDTEPFLASRGMRPSRVHDITVKR
jgi:cellulose synthase/poly-beta-1,6-N-acetylglucosamine synthase-like glycosyltransferase